MKIKENFILRKIAGDDVVVPIGENIADFNGAITLNETAALLWKERISALTAASFKGSSRFMATESCRSSSRYFSQAP